MVGIIFGSFLELAARFPFAAEVDIADFFHIGEVEGVEGVDVVKIGPSSVPGMVVRVQESDDGRQAVVVVDDVGQVGHALVAFVRRGGMNVGIVGVSGGGDVSSVNEAAPVSKLGCHLGNVIVSTGGRAHDDGSLAVVCSSRERGYVVGDSMFERVMEVGGQM